MVEHEASGRRPAGALPCATVSMPAVEVGVASHVVTRSIAAPWFSEMGHRRRYGFNLDKKGQMERPHSRRSVTAAAGSYVERWKMFVSTKRGVGRAAMVLSAAALSVSGLSFALAGPASAKATTVAAPTVGHVGAKVAPVDPSDCPANALCYWEHANYGGTALYGTLGQDFPSGACAEFPPGWNDRISSLVNTSDRNLVFYTDANCQGASFTLPPGSQSGDLRDFNDQITTVRI
jgi:hypothetical protein